MRHLIAFGFVLVLVSSDCSVISELDELVVGTIILTIGTASLALEDQSFSSKSSFMLAFDSKFKDTPTAALCKNLCHSAIKSFLIDSV